MTAPPQEREDKWIRNAVSYSDVGARIPFMTVIATLGFAASVVYGIWALNQTQLASVENQIKGEHTQFQSLFSSIREELSRRESELKASIAAIEQDLARRRSEFVGQDEFRQAQQRELNDIKILQDRLNIIEQTRPTTGELQATSSALRDRIDKLYELIQKQEDWIRAHPAREK